MELNQKQSKHLRTLGHQVSPVVTVADKGLTENVIAAIEEALDIHELIKVKVRLDRTERAEIFNQIVAESGAYRVQTIGMVILLFRPTKARKIELPGPKLKLA
jgi:RNA-binding protein